MSISNSAYQNELEKLPISTGNPVYRFIRVGLICTSQNVDGVCSCAA